MKIILKKTYDKLGNPGDLITVKDGFARNYLIPNKKAIRASEENKKFFTPVYLQALSKFKVPVILFL